MNTDIPCSERVKAQQNSKIMSLDEFEDNYLTEKDKLFDIPLPKKMFKKSPSKDAKTLTTEDFDCACENDQPTTIAQFLELELEETLFLADDNQRQLRKKICAFVKDNNHSDKVKIFAKEAIVAIMDTTNFINTFEEFKTYYCDCNCSGSETEFTNDLANNMEPKWGQLANKQEILAEINSIPSLSSLTFDKQILALENHFNQNLKYGINQNNEPYIINPSHDIDKYIYTEVAGWLDFHHIFKLFKWAREKGPTNALLGGEMGELVQSLAGNYSAYSYEDLPSNNVGVALFIRFGQQLQAGTITWNDAVNIALDEMKWIEPEKAPNFDYIPYIHNEFYPKNFTYQPLLGNLLREYHKKKFCERPLKEQQRTREVHEKFHR